MNMWRKLKQASLGFGILLAFLFINAYTGVTQVVAASPGEIVINELMYNPGSGNQDDEYLELHNTTGHPIDLEDWCFTDGITLETTNPNDPSCFEAGTIITAGGYLIISPNPAQTQATYGMTTAASYGSSNLSNGGETVTLVDNNAIEIDSVEYDDSSPWPFAPDGNGPSLELKDPSLDNNDPANWGASITPTPNAQNSLFGIVFPSITSVSKPTGIQPSDAVTITANIDSEDSVDLVYKVMFESEQTVTMYDDGNHGDGTAGDGIYGAQIPGQAAGQLVRYKIVATNTSVESSSPGNDDSINYFGYVVNDGGASALPIVRWYMEPADFEDMTTNHLLDDEEFPAVFTIGDQVIDNSRVNVKGQSSTAFPKRKYKFNLPSGHTLGAPYFDHPMKEFAIQVYFLNLTDFQEGLAWKAFETANFIPLQNRYVRVQANFNSQPDPSAFYGHFLLLENYDGFWRERNNYETGAFYKEFDNKKTREDEDHGDIQSLRNNLETLEGDQLKKYVYDNLDIPAIINFNAIAAVIDHDDWSFYRNIYQYRDTEGTQRWSYLPWDLDNALVPPIYEEETGVEGLLNPLEIVRADARDTIYIEQALYQFPEFKEMFDRRAATLFDELYGNNQLVNWHNQYYDQSEPDLVLDHQYWGDEKQDTIEQFLPLVFPDGMPDFPADFPLSSDQADSFIESATPEQTRIVYNWGLNRFKNNVNNLRQSGELVTSQPANPPLIITELMYQPEGGSQHEYIELYNPNSYAVDLSNWQFTAGVELTIPAGSVIPARSYAVTVKNDTAFRAHYGSGRYVLAEYNGDLSDQGETVTLIRPNSTTAVSLLYQNSAPWPSSPAGGGFSLALLGVGADYTLPQCWAPSINNGTPAFENSGFDSSWVKTNSGNCFDQNNLSSGLGGQSLANTGVNQYVLFVVFLLISGVFYGLFHRQKSFK